MTPAEFKAWFEGFTEGMDGKPNDKQWKAICERVKTIDGTQLVTRTFVDRYIERYRDPLWSGLYWGATTSGATSKSVDVSYQAALGGMGAVASQTSTLSADDLLRQMGRADYADLKAA